jgi:uncharacterized membrane protein YvlD (DUF360 family)
MKFLLRLLICALVIFLIAYRFPSLIVVDNFVTALIAALVLAVVNAFNSSSGCLPSHKYS